MEQKKLTGYPATDKPWLKYYSEEATHTVFRKNTMFRYLYECNKDHLDDISLIYFDCKITYRALFQKIDQVAKAFQALGIRAGDIVTFSMPIIPETVYALYALNKLGAIPNLIDFQTNGEWIADNMRNTGSRYVLSLDLCYPAIADVIKMTDVFTVIIASIADSMPLAARFGYEMSTRKARVNIHLDKRCIQWNDFLKQGQNVDQICEPEYVSHTPAAIVYTGGTTGKPKGAVLSNDNINTLAQQFALTFSHFSRGHRFLDIMPPVVPYGLCGGLHTPLTCGMETVMERYCSQL